MREKTPRDSLSAMVLPRRPRAVVNKDPDSGSGRSHTGTCSSTVAGRNSSTKWAMARENDIPLVRPFGTRVLATPVHGRSEKSHILAAWAFESSEWDAVKPEPWWKEEKTEGKLSVQRSVLQSSIAKLNRTINND
ncbi:hypothetical protein SCAR479_01956 [Seiridium cardinale]|uniref:Uncharacterized protein n=1 Tax=Seiridium cardinale TaxID=138064 RepID=A0ABR2Y3V9_9PEZI